MSTYIIQVVSAMIFTKSFLSFKPSVYRCRFIQDSTYRRHTIDVCKYSASMPDRAIYDDALQGRVSLLCEDILPRL